MPPTAALPLVSRLRAKLVCTLGPAVEGRIEALARAGMDVARVNLAHGSPGEHAGRIAAVRRAEAVVGRPIAVLADLPGPKVRLGEVPGGELELAAGDRFELRPPGAPAQVGGAATTHAGLVDDLRHGDRILLADGAVELIVVGRDGDRLIAAVERGGHLRSRAGLSAPADRLSLPALTDNDRGAIGWLLEQGVDWVGLSFVRRADDVRVLRDLLGRGGPRIVAKIETRSAVAEVDEILAVADGLMVARGDLGVELSFEEVPLTQKRLVARAIAFERPAIVATQMLESMTAAPRPTRAEASDVANALLDGADAVMLSGETAVGRFPVAAAEAMVRIMRATERGNQAVEARGRACPDIEAPETREPGPGVDVDRDARAVAVAAAALARADRDVEALACYTRTGRTARLLAALRPPVPILALTPSPAVARSLVLHHGVVPETCDAPPTVAGIERALAAALDGATDAGRIGPGAAVVLVATSAGGLGGPNLVEVRRRPGPGGVDPSPATDG